MAISVDNQGIYQRAGLSGTKPEENSRGSSNLDQEDFLALLTTQLAAQDPFNPVGNEEFVAQMAQFSSLEGMNQLNESFEEVANSLSSNQALQASTLVGREVLLPSNLANYRAGEAVTGTINVESNTQAGVLQVVDQAGQLINEMSLGDMRGPNEIEFGWDGTDMHGNRVPEGTYQIQVLGNVGGQQQALATNIRAHVESVNIEPGNNGIFLNLAGLGSVPLSSVREIGEG